MTARSIKVALTNKSITLWCKKETQVKKLDIEINKLEYFSMYDYIAFKFLNKEQKQIYKRLSYDLKVDYIESFESDLYDSFIYEDNKNKRS